MSRHWATTSSPSRQVVMLNTLVAMMFPLDVGVSHASGQASCQGPTGARPGLLAGPKPLLPAFLLVLLGAEEELLEGGLGGGKHELAGRGAALADDGDGLLPRG